MNGVIVLITSLLMSPAHARQCDVQATAYTASIVAYNEANAKCNGVTTLSACAVARQRYREMIEAKKALEACTGSSIP